MTIDFNSVAREMHEETAREQFWQHVKGDAERLAFVHLCWSHALEAQLNGERLWCHICADGMEPCDSEECSYYTEDDCALGFRDHEPSGIARHLIDGVLLLLDLAADWNITLPDDVFGPSEPIREVIENLSVGDLVTFLHDRTDKLWMSDREISSYLLPPDFADITAAVFMWLEKRGTDPADLLWERLKWFLYHSGAPLKAPEP